MTANPQIDFEALVKLVEKKGFSTQPQSIKQERNKVLRGLKVKPNKAKKEQTTCEGYCEPEEPKGGKKVAQKASKAKQEGKESVDQVKEQA